MARKQCLMCPQAFESNRPHAKYCGDTCRKRAQRGAPQYVAAAASAVDVSADDLVAAVTAELTAAARESSALGVQAIRLARIAQNEVGTGFVSLSKELRAVMASALQNAQVEADPVDELRARRAAKRAATG